MAWFSLGVSIANAVVWLAYYLFSGGFFLETETAGVRLSTIITFFVVSGITLLVEIYTRNINKGRFFRSLINNTVLTSLLSGIVCFVYYGSIPFLDRVWGMALILVGTIFYYTCFLVENHYNLFYRIIGFLIIFLVLLFFTNKQVSEFGLGIGLVLGFPPSLTNAIYNKYQRIKGGY